jgi:beta-lactamase superfamily II metal-dependent hydrolase
MVDLIIISHTDADHCRGLNDFIDNYTQNGFIKRICFNVDRNVHKKTNELLLKRILEYNKVSKIVLDIGVISTEKQEQRLMMYEGTELSIIYPDKVDEAQAYLQKSTNDMSIVCLLKNTGMQMLFTGDLGSKGWYRLFAKNDKISCNILKMPHHGAYYEGGKEAISSDEIIERLKPEVAIISSGQNDKYKHPDRKTIELLAKKEIDIYCTQYTKMCNKGVCAGSSACSGDIYIKQNTKYYIETEFSTELTSPVCISSKEGK